jgi:hypothetical protein
LRFAKIKQLSVDNSNFESNGQYNLPLIKHNTALLRIKAVNQTTKKNKK